MQLVAATLETPLGPLWCLDRDGALVGVAFDDGRAGLELHLRRHLGPYSVRERADVPGVRALARYFAGDLDALERIDAAPAGTDFQRDVWRHLRTIPRGSTLSYGDLAAQIGRPGAVRAVGTANGANPVPVVVPCHRVIGRDGSLTGYGGGMPRKRWLLDHEGAVTSAASEAQQTLPL